jgi:L-lactate dehydrogenase complex protein LldE
VTRRVALFATCVADQLFPGVAHAAVAVLQRAGCTVTFDPAQTCCGQPAFNSGFHDEARFVARHHVAVFERADTVVAPSASCVAMVHRLPQLLRDDGDWHARAERVADRTYELSAFLVRELRVTDVGARLGARVAWHDACHGLRELGLRDEPRALLRAVRGLELVELAAGDACCGFGGTFAVKNAAVSTAMGQDKVDGVISTGASVCVAADNSCLMQIGGLLRRQDAGVRCMHLAEVLAATAPGGPHR